MSKVLFDHIAMAIPRMADAPAVLAGVPTDGASSAVFNWGVWRFEGGGDLEILEPRGPDGFVHRFLAAHGPGLHHVTFKVPSLDEACARAERHGYTIVGRDDSDPRARPSASSSSSPKSACAPPKVIAAGRPLRARRIPRRRCESSASG